MYYFGWTYGVLEFFGGLSFADKAAFIAAPPAGKAIRARILPVLRFAVRYVDHSQVVRQLFKWHFSLKKSCAWKDYNDKKEKGKGVNFRQISWWAESHVDQNDLSV